MKRKLGETFRFVELANDVNEHMPTYVVHRIQAMLNQDSLSVKGAHILVLGLAYKPGTSDARETPSLPVIDGLLELGATIAAADPYVDMIDLDKRVERVQADGESLKRADLVLILTDHPDFDYDLIEREAQRIFDTRNCLRHSTDPKIERL